MTGTFAFSAGTAMASSQLPAGACDCHIHVYGAHVPAATDAQLHPPHARITDYRRVQQRMPARAPAGVVQRLNTEINKALKDNTITELADKLGITLVGGSPKVLADVQASDSATWARVIRTANIKID